jgi:hypothetical protein
VITKLALLTALFVMTLTVVYQGATVKQQQQLIRSMMRDKACMNDSRPAQHSMPEPGGDPKPSPAVPAHPGRQNTVDNSWAGPRDTKVI